MPKPSFFIGIGGTGDWVLTFLKAKLLTKYGEVPDKVCLRLLDTISSGDRDAAFSTEDHTYVRKTIDSGEHREAVAKVGSHRIDGNEYVFLGNNVKNRAFYDLSKKIDDAENHPGRYSDEEHLTWFQASFYNKVVPQAQFSLTDGAGQWRQFGRMALFFSSNGLNSDVVNIIRKNLADLKRKTRDEKIAVYIIASLAGGTGAGAFLDVANLVRYCSNDMNIDIYLMGMLVFPGTFKHILGSKINNAQAYAAFLELHRFQSSFGNQDPFIVKYGKNFETKLSEKLFDGVYLLDADRRKNSLSDVRPEEGLFPSIADGLELFLDADSGQQLFQNTCNVTSEHARTVITGNSVPAIYSSFGAWKIILPARLYARKFAYQIVRAYIEELAQPMVEGETVIRLKNNIREGREVPVDHRSDALEVLRSSHAFLGDFLDLLPGQRLNAQLKSFAEGLEPKRILAKYFTVKDPGSSRLVQTEGERLTREVLSGVKDGSQTQLPASEAIKQIRTSCEALRDAYFKESGEFIQAQEKVIRLIKEEIFKELDQKLRSELVGGASYIKKLGTLGYFHALLGNMINILQTIQDQVLGEIQKRIHQKRRTVKDAERRAKDSLTDMEATHDCNSGLPFSKKHKSISHRAQQEYISRMGEWIEREQLERLLAALDQILGDIVQRVTKWSEEVKSWAGYLCEGIQIKKERFVGGYRECTLQIEEVNNELRRIGKSYTSSIGLTAWNPGNGDFGTDMEGWEDDLYQEMSGDAGGTPIWREWLEKTKWEVVFKEPPEKQPVFGLTIGENTSSGKKEPQISRENIHRVLFDDAFNRIYNEMQEVSILDYLARQDENAIVQLLVDKVSPLLDAMDGGEKTEQFYLMYQNQARHGEFIDRLFNELQKRPGYGGVVHRLDKFEDPYTFTFAVMLDRVVESEIRQVGSYAKEYWDYMKKVEYEGLHQRRFHTFRCEQEAANIEKKYYDKVGNYGRCKCLAPLAYRLLEYPGRVKSFIKAQVFTMIWFETDPRSGARTWVLAYQPKPQGASIKDVLDRKIEGIVLAKNLSDPDLLEALSGFVLRGTCLERPAINISYERVDKFLADERIRISEEKSSEFDRWEKKIIQIYEGWLNEISDHMWWQKQQVTGNEWERESLRIIYEYYLTEEQDHWRKQIA